MTKENGLSDLKSRLRNLGIQITCIAIDVGLLSGWVVLQYWIELLLKRLRLSGINEWVLLAFQVIFAVSTLGPVIIYIYRDIRVMIIRAQRQVRREAELDKAEGDDDEQK